ncbi:MAG: RNA polymerase sporulation sigma factor SigK, partial [Syntrophomonadaceae bacterium]|nr:RNA polymerase sporulation sigma factor SigK [Syntrophomonadaceae bacterium]
MTVLASILAISAALVKGFWLFFGYLNNQVFPQPLDEKRERFYLQKLEEGSEEAEHVLTEHNLRLVAHVVKKYENSGEELDDLISIGTIGLIKAIKTYSGERGVRLATYAARCIENEVLMHLRNIKNIKQEISLYEPIGYDQEGGELSLIDVLTIETDIVDMVDLKIQEEKIRSNLDILSERERQII